MRLRRSYLYVNAFIVFDISTFVIILIGISLILFVYYILRVRNAAVIVPRHWFSQTRVSNALNNNLEEFF